MKRALRLATEQAVAAGKPAPQAVVTGTKSETFVTAVHELTLCIPVEQLADAKGHPYYSPFGSARDSGRGYKSIKYPSNGTSDTASRWQARPFPPVVLVSGTSPKAFRFDERGRDQLEEFFNVKSAQEHFSGRKPELLDFAIWCFRSTELEDRFGSQPKPADLVGFVVAALNLTELELSALFGRSEIPMIPLVSIGSTT